MVVVVVWLVGDLKVLKTTTLIASEAGYNRYRAATIAVLLLGLDGLAVAKEMVVSSCGGSSSTSSCSNLPLSLHLRAICHEVWVYSSSLDSRGWVRSSGAHNHSVLRSRVRLQHLGL